MTFPNPPQKPTPPPKTVEREVLYRTQSFKDSYDSDNPPSIADILLCLDINDPKEFEYVTVQIFWSEPDFPMPPIPKGLIAKYSKYEEAPNPFYESEYKEYLKDLQQYREELEIYKVAVGGLAENKKQEYTDSLLDIMEKLKEIQEEIVEIGNIV